MSANEKSNEIAELINKVSQELQLKIIEENEIVSKKLLNIFGYPNNIYLKKNTEKCEYFLNDLLLARVETVWIDSDIYVKTEYHPSIATQTSHQ
jgi:hypothetical protein